MVSNSILRNVYKRPPIAFIEPGLDIAKIVSVVNIEEEDFFDSSKSARKGQAIILEHTGERFITDETGPKLHIYGQYPALLRAILPECDERIDQDRFFDELLGRHVRIVTVTVEENDPRVADIMPFEAGPTPCIFRSVLFITNSDFADARGLVAAHVISRPQIAPGLS